MKITTFLTVAIAAALTLTQAAPTEEFAGHKISLSLNPDHKRDYRSAMTKLTRRYPQMKWRRDPRRPFRDYLAGAKVTVTNYGPDYEVTKQNETLLCLKHRCLSLGPRHVQCLFK
jgi:hypothetical protein